MSGNDIKYSESLFDYEATGTVYDVAGDTFSDAIEGDDEGGVKYLIEFYPSLADVVLPEGSKVYSTVGGVTRDEQGIQIYLGSVSDEYSDLHLVDVSSLGDIIIPEGEDVVFYDLFQERCPYNEGDEEYSFCEGLLEIDSGWSLVNVEGIEALSSPGQYGNASATYTYFDYLVEYNNKVYKITGGEECTGVACESNTEESVEEDVDYFFNKIAVDFIKSAVNNVIQLEGRTKSE